MVFFSITIDSIQVLSKPFDGASSYGSNGSLFVFEFDFYEKLSRKLRFTPNPNINSYSNTCSRCYSSNDKDIDDDVMMIMKDDNDVLWIDNKNMDLQHEMAMSEDEDWYRTFIIGTNNAADTNDDTNNNNDNNNMDRDERRFNRLLLALKQKNEHRIVKTTNQQLRRGKQQQQRRRRRRRRAVEEINPDMKLWPNLPTFKQFLRRESELRLMILGPGFADTIKDEASWRLKLYEKWLVLLEDGYGEDETFVNTNTNNTNTKRNRINTKKKQQQQYAKRMRKRDGVTPTRERNSRRMRRDDIR